MSTESGVLHLKMWPRTTTCTKRAWVHEGGMSRIRANAFAAPPKNFLVNDSDFTEFYERYRALCIRAGVEPVTPERAGKLLSDWQPLDLTIADLAGGDAAADGRPNSRPSRH